jgi:cytochrome b
MKNLKSVLIWDLPTRVFHWLLAAGFSIAASLAFVAGEDSPLFPYHAMAGLTIVLMVVLRLFWGVVGSRHARFSSFAFAPRAVFEYMHGLLRGRDVRHAGHNPASAWAIFVMLGLVLVLAATGLLLGQGNEGLKDVHEFSAYAMLAVVVLHILGVVLHTVRHRENLTASMIHGRKDADAGDEIGTSHRGAALSFCILSAAWASGLLANYDAATQTTRLPLIGVSMQIGEVEDEGHRDQGQHDEDD